MAPVRVERVSTFAGIHEVFDLTVDHPLHNFIAAGVLVHNKQNTAYCFPDESRQTRYDGVECVCGDGSEGVTVCTDTTRHVGFCSGCPDGGTPDAGP